MRPMQNRYYQPEAETMPVNEIKKLQEYKLIRQVRYVYEHVEYYRKLMEEKGYAMKEDAGRGWRRVVASPMPVEIIELNAIKDFEPTKVVVSTYQAISGAGKTFKDWPEMMGNIIPYIGGEEEKSEKEPLRIWGHIENGVIVPAESPIITSQCIRVPVLNGHTATVFMDLAKKVTKEEIIEKWVNFTAEPQKLKLPSAPEKFIQYLEEDNRPQVALDVDYERGMGVSAGRLREDSIFDWKFVGLSHNTLRGAAGGGVLSAEMLTAKGYITKK